MKNKLIKILLTLLLLNVSVIINAQSPITVNAVCSDSASLGQYSFTGILNGKPYFKKGTLCGDHLDELECQIAVYDAPYTISWHDTAWVWQLEETAACFWFFETCTPLNQNVGPVLIAYNNSDTPLPPAVGWIGCDPRITDDYTCNINQPNVPTNITLCGNGNGTLTIPNSQTGLNYFLKSISSNLIINGPIAGNNASINLNAGFISSNSSYEIYASRVIDSAICNLMSSPINLIVSGPVTTNITSILCSGDSINVGTSTHTQSGTYKDTLSRANGCDSIIITNLTVRNAIVNFLSPVLCAGESITIANHTYSELGNYIDTLTSVTGCDSILFINVGVTTLIDVSIVNNSPTLSSNETSANFQWLDCTNNYAHITGETGASYTALTDGNFAVEITKNGCSDTSSCISITTIGLKNILSQKIVCIYPNPSNGIFTVMSAQAQCIVITNELGQKVYGVNLSKGESTIDISHLGNGVYSVKVQTTDRSEVIKYIKQ